MNEDIPYKDRILRSVLNEFRIQAIAHRAGIYKLICHPDATPEQKLMACAPTPDIEQFWKGFVEHVRLALNVQIVSQWALLPSSSDVLVDRHRYIKDPLKITMREFGEKLKLALKPEEIKEPVHENKTV